MGIRLWCESKNAKNSALEFYYYYRMQEDDFPLINGGITNALKVIEQNCIALDGEDILEKMKKLKEKMKNDSLKKYYLLDQFLNLIDKIKYEDIKKEKENKKLYQLAYLFTFFRRKKVNNSDFFEDLLKKSKNIILYGAPGTGKTYTSEENILRILEENENKDIEEERFVKIQFHPSYGYEDFIEGLKPHNNNDGHISLELKDGEFKKFCKTAIGYQSKYIAANEDDKIKWAFFFLVDEINRAELSRVFGEIMYSLEKRGQGIKTQYSYLQDEEEFIVPENIYFIGTMNDVDRSIDSFDIALRRRFFWYRMDCDYGVIANELKIYNNIGEFDKQDNPKSGYLKACFSLNQFITKDLGLGKLYELGHSYFLNIKLHAKYNEKIKNKDLNNLFDFSVEPLLKEYLRAEFTEEDIEKHIKQARGIFKLDDTNS